MNSYQGLWVTRATVLFDTESKHLVPFYANVREENTDVLTRGSRLAGTPYPLTQRKNITYCLP